MNFCKLSDLYEQPLIQNNEIDKIFMDNSRDFTIYETSNFYLQKFAEANNFNLNSNEFRLFLQKNPNKLNEFIKIYRSQNIIHLK